MRYTRYPSGGLRGVAGSTRAAGYGRTKDYMKRAHEEICLLVQAETRKSLANLEAIAEVEGVDGIFIGRSFNVLCASDLVDAVQTVHPIRDHRFPQERGETRRPKAHLLNPPLGGGESRHYNTIDGRHATSSKDKGQEKKRPGQGAYSATGPLLHRDTLSDTDAAGFESMFLE